MRIAQAKEEKNMKPQGSREGGLRTMKLIVRMHDGKAMFDLDRVLSGERVKTESDLGWNATAWIEED